MNRRSFLNTTVAAGATLAVGRTWAEDRSKPVRLGIIGTGGRGTGLLQTLLFFPQVEVPAVCDLVRDRASQSAGLVEEQTRKRPDIYGA
jgi:predicted homoserine dehydrogenase-like protein